MCLRRGEESGSSVQSSMYVVLCIGMELRHYHQRIRFLSLQERLFNFNDFSFTVTLLEISFSINGFCPFKIKKIKYVIVDISRFSAVLQ